MKKCLFYGDSNTYGVDIAGGHSGARYPEDVRFTGILQESLKDEWEFAVDPLWNLNLRSLRKYLKMQVK